MIKPRIVVLLAAAVGASGCATYRYGTHQSIAVVTDPPRATCRFERGGNVVARVASTPGEASVERSVFITRLVCAREDHFDESVELVSEQSSVLALRDPATRADAIVDGAGAVTYGTSTVYTGAYAGLGLASPALALGMLAVVPIAFSVDLATGAWVGLRPPPVIVLSPSRFESEAHRDEHFATRRREYEAEAAPMRREIEEGCWRARCAYELGQFDRALKARLERLETLRMAASIRAQPP